jgi:hypothetical protein
MLQRSWVPYGWPMQRRAVAFLVAACALVATGSATAAETYDQLSRTDFNRLAARENLSLFWIADDDADKTVDPDEITELLFYPAAPAWTDSGGFTPAFDAAYTRMITAAGATIDDPRLALVAKELDQGRPTLVRNDFSGLSDADKQFVGHMLKVADMIDALFDRTTGAAKLASKVPADPLSQSLFRRNRGPRCDAVGNPKCSAIPGSPEPLVDIYPASLQSGNFCPALEKREDADTLLSPFTVVRRRHGLEAVPYTVAYREPMAAIGAELDAAAKAVTDPDEGPLIAYLRAAAKGFRTNNWEPADEAWVAMNAMNSKWYVRVGPDEVSVDPCGYKASFHLTFARTNARSIETQQQLAPLRQDMEAAFAAKAGKPYKARKVTFHLPDFIDIILNAGDDRFGLGIVTGQSLPNWGKVAEESRGRTVVMSNLYTDADSLAIRRAQAATLLDKAALAQFPVDPELSLRSNILHEASHNLGPTGQYRVRGKTDSAIFGGGIASVLEEAKAEVGGLFLIDLLRRKGVLSQQDATDTYADQLQWAFEQIAAGLYYSDGVRDPYAQLAAIEVGYLLDQHALTWKETTTSGDGKYHGAFSVHPDKFAPTDAKLLQVIAGIKARGDKAAAVKLLHTYVDDPRAPTKAISKRFGRFNRASFVYAIDR